MEALELDQMLYLEDIVLPEGVELSLLTQEEPVNEPIVAVRLLQIQEEEPEVEELLEGEEGDEAETEGEESSESEGASEDSKEE